MAAPALTQTQNFGSRTQVFTITQSGANQGSVDLNLTRPIAAMNFMVQGTMASASIALTVSNDGTNFEAPITAFTAMTVDGHTRALTITTDGGWTHFRLTWSAATGTSNTVLTVSVKYF